MHCICVGMGKHTVFGEEGNHDTYGDDMHIELAGRGGLGTPGDAWRLE